MNDECTVNLLYNTFLDIQHMYSNYISPISRLMVGFYKRMNLLVRTDQIHDVTIF